MNDNDRKAAKTALNKFENGFFEKQNRFPNALELWFAALEYMSSQQSQEWISVDERLPEVHQSVIGFMPKWVSELRVYIVYRSDGMWWSYMHRKPPPVSHWMPLPAQPTTDKP